MANIVYRNIDGDTILLPEAPTKHTWEIKHHSGDVLIAEDLVELLLVADNGEVADAAEISNSMYDLGPTRDDIVAAAEEMVRNFNIRVAGIHKGEDIPLGRLTAI